MRRFFRSLHGFLTGPFSSFQSSGKEHSARAKGGAKISHGSLPIVIKEEGREFPYPHCRHDEVSI